MAPNRPPVYFRATPIECKRPRKPVERRSDRATDLPRDRPRVTRSDHDGAFIIALFQQPLSAVCPSPLGCSAGRGWACICRWASSRIRRAARLGAFGLLRGGRLALHLALRILRTCNVAARAIHRLGRRMLLGVRANAGGLAAALRRRPGTGVLVCCAAHIAGPGPCGAGAKDDDGATGKSVVSCSCASPLFSCRAPRRNGR